VSVANPSLHLHLVRSHNCITLYKSVKNNSYKSVTMIITRALSITNFVIAGSALSFQVGVLYPWHKQLDDGFEELKKEHLRVLQAVESKVQQTRDAAVLEESRNSVRGLLGNLAAWKA
jgi:hypothetical protein